MAFFLFSVIKFQNNKNVFILFKIIWIIFLFVTKIKKERNKAKKTFKTDGLISQQTTELQFRDSKMYAGHIFFSAFHRDLRVSTNGSPRVRSVSMRFQTIRFVTFKLNIA